jgi:hypothetical protein
MRAMPGDIRGSIKIILGVVAQPSPREARGRPRGDSAPARGKALKTEVGEFFHHVELGNKVADIFSASIGYYYDQA